MYKDQPDAGEGAPLIHQDSSTTESEKLNETVKPVHVPVQGEAPNKLEQSTHTSEDMDNLLISIKPEHKQIVVDFVNNNTVILCSDAIPYWYCKGKNSRIANPMSGRKLNIELRSIAKKYDSILTDHDLYEISEFLKAFTEIADKTARVWMRIAEDEDSVLVDLGDGAHNCVRISANGVYLNPDKPEPVFRRTTSMRALPVPAKTGDTDLLKKHVSVKNADFILLLAWITYTLAHPRIATTNFLLLVLVGGQGSGKSFLSRLIQMLIDPSALGVQSLPSKKDDFVIALEHSFASFFDNTREIDARRSDLFCIACTGGTLPSRKLYTNSELQVHHVHAPLVVNSIHPIINQSDLAQRALVINLDPLKPSDRRSEKDLIAAFEADLPVIFRGLLDLIADCFKHLPEVEVSHSERMIDFVMWLAAMEKAHGLERPVYQAHYSASLQQGQLDSLMDNPLASAILDFAKRQKGEAWSGTPTKLLENLNTATSLSSFRSKGLPDNPIALSKRLQTLQAALHTQGVEVGFQRGKTRIITIFTTKDFNHD